MPNPGKISSLPHDLRQQLNCRLRGNQTPRDILLWLNAQPSVRSLLARRFQGRPITGDNLSEYKLHGSYGQWLDSQRAAEIAFSLCDPQARKDPLLANCPPSLLELCRFGEWTKRPEVRAKLYAGLAPDTMALLARDLGLTPRPPPSPKPPKP